MVLRRAVTALLACLVLAPVGCGGGDGGEGDGGETRGETLSGTGYSVVLPEGWQESTEEANTGAINFDLVLTGERESGFLTNVNVIREEPQRVPEDVDDLVETFTQQLGAVTGVRPEPLPERELDGEAARGNTVEAPTSAVQYFTIHDDAIYTVTLSAARTALADARAGFTELLDSWRWE